MTPDSGDDLIAAATWAGFSLTPPQITALLRFGSWLGEEAIPAGGLGPGERSRLGRRHLADSLLFAVGWKQGPPPPSLVDLGSGVGLPGIPLAISFPETAVVLLDRAGRRSQLARRAVRVLGLPNVTVITGTIEDHGNRYPAAVSRGSLPPDRLRPLLPRILLPGGVAIVGWRWGGGDEPPPEGYEPIVVPAEVLDSPIELLRMTAGAG